MVSTTEEVATPVEVQQPAEIRNINEEEFEKAQKLFQQGKKNLFLNKYDESVNNFGDACKTYAAKYGEMDPQCADVYFFYGRALLELARMENNVLGNALTGVPEETEPINDSRYGNPEDVAAEEKEEIAEKVIDAMCATDEEIKAEDAAANDEGAAKPEVEETPAVEAAALPAAATETPAENATAAATETPAEAAAAEGEEAADGEEEEEEGDEVEGEGEETAEDKESDEDIGNLQSSWEMFELAKVIYTKNFNEDLLFKNKRIAECLLKLGEISIEQESYEQAITDIAESVRVQEEIAAADRDERMLAESYYQLGLARQFNNQFGDANEAYQRSINILQLRIEKLRGKLVSVGEGADADLERNTINEEINELEGLLPEMTSKLEEVNEQGQQTLNLIKEAKECFTSTVAANGAAAVTAAANGDVKDITSMVKSKRKIDSVDESGSIKKTRLSSEGCEQPEANGETIEVDENKENQHQAEERMEESAAVAASKEQVGNAEEEQPAAAVVEPTA